MRLTVELFAGIGGFRLAADQCGFRTVWANDMNPKSCAVYRGGVNEGKKVDSEEFSRF